MRALSDTEKQIVRLRDRLGVLRRALEEAQRKYNYAPRGKRRDRLQACRKLNIKVLKAEAELLKLKRGMAA